MNMHSKDRKAEDYGDVQGRSTPITGVPAVSLDSAKRANAAQSSARSKGREKSANAFRTISEVADLLDVPQHVLRFWETKFTQIKPLKRGGGRRYYRPEDIALLQAIHHLLYTEGYTIKGVQKLLREVGKKQIVANFAEGESKDPSLSRAAIDAAAIRDDRPSEGAMQGLDAQQREVLRSVLTELRDLRGMIKKRD